MIFDVAAANPDGVALDGGFALRNPGAPVQARGWARLDVGLAGFHASLPGDDPRLWWLARQSGPGAADDLLGAYHYVGFVARNPAGIFDALRRRLHIVDQKTEMMDAEVILAAVLETDDRAAVLERCLERLLRQVDVPTFRWILGRDAQAIRFDLADGGCGEAAGLDPPALDSREEVCAAPGDEFEVQAETLGSVRMSVAWTSGSE